MKVAAIQFEPEFMNRQANIKRMIELSSETDADLIVFPELSTTGYCFESKAQVKKVAEDIVDSDFIARFVHLAEKKQSAIAVGFPEIDFYGHLYNSSALFFPEQEFLMYRKIHLFREEKLLFEPGNIPLQVTEFRGVNIGMMICFDWIFPEVARKLMREGAQVICHLANLVLPYCQKAMPIRALENRLFTITANRIGSEKMGDSTVTFTGGSIICGPDSSVLAHGPVDREIVLETEIKPELALDKNITKYNNILDDSLLAL